MGKHLPGLSYGMSGGPWSIAWRQGAPRAARRHENEEGPGKFTYEIKKGATSLGDFTFDAVSLWHGDIQAKRKQEELGGTYFYFVRYEGDHPAQR